MKIYRELCTEAGCLDILDSTIEKRIHSILRDMRELRTQYNGAGVILPRVDITEFALG